MWGSGLVPGHTLTMAIVIVWSVTSNHRSKKMVPVRAVNDNCQNAKSQAPIELQLRTVRDTSNGMKRPVDLGCNVYSRQNRLA